MRAIETRYSGYNFRSRLEARWAVFFDSLGVKWEYEPEGFILEDGSRYLPDFRTTYPDGSVFWFEVKGAIDEITDAEWAKMEGFKPPASHNGATPRLILLDGAPDMRMYCAPAEVRRFSEDEADPEKCFRRWFRSHERYGWALYSTTGRPWIDDHSNFFENPRNDLIAVLALAVQASRSARFEHGESGAT